MPGACSFAATASGVSQTVAFAPCSQAAARLCKQSHRKMAGGSSSAGAFMAIICTLIDTVTVLLRVGCVGVWVCGFQASSRQVCSGCDRFQTGSGQIPDGFQTGSRRVPDGFRTGSRLVPDGCCGCDRFQTGSRQVSDGFRTAARQQPDSCQTAARTQHDTHATCPGARVPPTLGPGLAASQTCPVQSVVS